MPIESICQTTGIDMADWLLDDQFIYPEGAMSKARQQAFKQAKDMGANTVVWGPFHTEVGATSVHGNAHECK